MFATVLLVCLLCLASPLSLSLLHGARPLGPPGSHFGLPRRAPQQRPHRQGDMRGTCATSTVSAIAARPNKARRELLGLRMLG